MPCQSISTVEMLWQGREDFGQNLYLSEVAWMPALLELFGGA